MLSLKCTTAAVFQPTEVKKLSRLNGRNKKGLVISRCSAPWKESW